MEVKIARAEPTPPPAKIILELDEKEAQFIHGLLRGSDWYKVREFVFGGDDDGRANGMHAEMSAALKVAGIARMDGSPISGYRWAGGR